MSDPDRPYPLTFHSSRFTPSRDDFRFMRRALQLASRARGRTSPNPMVGAVVVREGRIVGEGYHRRAGEPHAEILALEAAGERARSADLYVTLEPCAHYGRTPPCVDAVFRAGVRRVVAAMEDPNPEAAGGLARLRAAGIETVGGVLEAEARHLNEAFIKHRARGLPFVTLKMAMTLDGRIATTTGDARWITGEPARRYVHRLRDRSDAVLVGIGTVRADDPLLTARLRGARNPLRVVLDTHASLSPGSQIARTARDVRTWVACGEAAPLERRAVLEALGIEILALPVLDGRVDPRALVQELARRSIMSLLVEGGAEVAASLLDARLVDRVEFLIAPRLIGGRGAPGPVGGPGRRRMADALPVARPRLRRLGEDWLISGYVHGDH